MNLRKGKTKSLLESSVDSALLAVEIYNKPRVTFRCECFITHMVMAWTRLFHAYFQNTIGEKYFYKEKNGRYKLVDGERKAWPLSKCVKVYGKLSPAAQANLEFFILLRNKIEHRCISPDEVGVNIFGECQSLLYNYERELVKLFGDEYALNENLAYSLQFSTVRKKEQIEANRKFLSSEAKDLKIFIDEYRSSMSMEIFNSQEYSVKVLLVPKVSNKSRSDLAVEYVDWNSTSEEDRERYERLSVIVKDRVIKQVAVNPGKLKPGDAIKKINKQIKNPINQYDHKCILAILSIRPYKDFNGTDDPYQTNVNYCHYDETHSDYVYQDAWVEFVVEKINDGKLTKDIWTSNFKAKKLISVDSL